MKWKTLRLVLVCSTIAATAWGQGRPGAVPRMADPLEIAADSSAAPAQKTTRSAESGLAVDTSNRQAVVDFYHDFFPASEGIAAEWSGSVSECDPGTTSTAYEDATLLRVNYYRAMAGLPADVVLSATWNAMCREAALMMIAEGNLSHSPGTGWACWTQDGATAAGRSNLAIGRAGPDAIRLYMYDNGISSVGHRQWVLFPPVKIMGTGSTTEQNGWFHGSNALWVIPDNLSAPRPAEPEWVAWPPEGFVPYQITDPNTFSFSGSEPQWWSFSLPRANFGSANVTMTRGGSPVGVTIIHRGTGGHSLPDSVLVWEPDIPSPGSPPDEDTTYAVTISGVVDQFGQTRTFGYDVTIIDPDSTPPSTPTPEPTTTATPTFTPTFTPTLTPTPTSTRTMTPTPTAPPPPPVAGDMNGDGFITGIDLFLFSASWGTQQGKAGFNSSADLDGDREVSADDLLRLMGAW